MPCRGKMVVQTSQCDDMKRQSAGWEMEIQFSQFVPGLSSTLGAVLQNPWDVAVDGQPGRACRAQTQRGSCSLLAQCEVVKAEFLCLCDEWCQVCASYQQPET